MKANTAVAFLLAGLSLGLLNDSRSPRRWCRVAQAAAIGVLAIGGLTFCEYLFGWNLGIDQLLCQDATPSTAPLYPGRMGVNTAFNFVLVGAALLGLSQKTRWSDWSSQLSCLLTMGIATLALVCHLFGVSLGSLLTVQTTTLATHTAITFIILASGILLTRVEHGFMRTFASSHMGGLVARQLLPWVVLLPLLLGWLVVQGERLRWYDPKYENALVIVGMMLTFLVLVWYNAQSVNWIDSQRQQAEEALQQANGTLARKVVERTAELTQLNDRLQCELFVRELAETALQQEADRQTAIISTQSEIATAGLELSQVMNLIVERSQQLIGADGAAIELAEDDEMVYRAACGNAATYVGLRLKISSSLSGQCFQTGETLRCDDTDVDSRVDRAACKRIGVRSMLVVPLQYDQKTLGILKVLAVQAHAFDDKDINTLLLMAGTLAAAIQYASEFESKQVLITERTAALEQIQLLQALRLTIAEAQDVDTALECVLATVGRFQNWSYGEVWLPDPQENVLKCQMTWCRNPQAANPSLSQFKTFTFPPGVGLPGRVWASQQPEWRTNVSTEPETIFPRCHLALESGIKTGVGVPLILDNQVLAVLVFFKFEATPENLQQIESLSTIATQLSLVIRRKQAELALQRSEAELRALFAAMRDVVLIRDAQGRCLKIAPTSTTDLIKNPAEMIGKTLHDVMPQSQADVILNQIQKALTLQQVVNCEYSLSVNDQQVCFATSISPFTADSVVLVARDITNRKQIETTLQESEERYRSIIAAVAEGIVFQQADGTITACNTSAESILGLSTKQMMGLTSIDPRWRAMHEDGSPFPGEEHPSMVTLRTGKPCSNIVMGVHQPNGTLTWILLNAQPLFRPGNALPYAVATSFLDISDRKQAEQALQDREALLRSVGDNLPNGAIYQYISEPDGTDCFSYMSAGIERLTEVKAENALRDPSLLFSQIIEEDIARYQQAVETSMRDLSTFDFQVRIRTSSDKLKWLHFRTTPRLVEDGRVIGNGLVIDITNLKQAEQALRQSEERLQLALEGSGDGLWDWNLTTDEVYLSPRYVEMLGYAVGELPETISTWEKLIHPEDQPWVLETLTAHFKDGSHPYAFDYRVLTKSDGWKWIGNYGKVVLRDEDGNPLRMTGTHKDISDRKRAEERQNMMLKLQQSNQELEQFAFIASHDLKEPLRTVRNFCSLLQSKHRESLNEKGQDYLNRIQNATQRMQALIDDLLSLSRVATQAKPFVLVDVAEVVRDVASGLQKQIQQTGGRIEVESLPTLYADPTQLSQLFQNLISNALKFHRSVPPCVRISSQFQSATGDAKNSECHQILVEDNGIGFDNKYRELIFGAFERLHGRGEYEGTGIGLAICKKIVERHGGSITVRSTPGHGSTFIITLPVGYFGERRSGETK